MKQSLTFTLIAVAMLAYPVLAATAEKAAIAAAPPAPASTAVILTGNSGKAVGAATVSEIPGGIFVQAAVEGLSPGWHAFHIHAVGDCSDAAEFKKSGGHLKHEGQMHGVMGDKGPHAGDLPNIWVGADGTGKAEYFSTYAAYKDLFGTGGSAFIVHAGPDDYKTDPSGSAGARVACGVIAPKKAD
jgi:superoxide dismutase, Cu-Zn family